MGTLGLIFVFVSRQWDVDIWEIIGNGLTAFDLVVGHELIFFGFLMTVGHCIDSHQKWKRLKHRRELTDERLKAMKATMTTVHDIVNNALNSLQIFRLEAQKHLSFPTDAIQQFDHIIYDTADRLKSIQASKVFAPYKISEGLTGVKECGPGIRLS